MMRWSINMGQSVGRELTGKTGVFVENLHQSYCVHCRSCITWPRIEPGAPWWEAGDWLPELWHDQQVFVFISTWILEVWEGQGELYVKFWPSWRYLSYQTFLCDHMHALVCQTNNNCIGHMSNSWSNPQYELQHEMYKQWSDFITRECSRFLNHKCHLTCI